MPENTGTVAEFEIRPATKAEDAALYELLRHYNCQYATNRKEYSYTIAENGSVVAGITAGGTVDTVEIEYLCV